MEGCVYVQRCVSVDDYTAPPLPNLDPSTNPLSGLTIRKVPILRIFGATQLGQKSCIHIHRVFPYLLIPASDIPEYKDEALVDIYKELEQALNSSYGVTNGQYIHDIKTLNGLHFYGYHDNESRFLKVLFYQSRYVKRCAELLLQGALRGCLVQPHEAHFPYSLQFLTDYNIHGMNLVYFKRVAFRVTESQYSKITVNDNPNYLGQEISRDTIPNRHMMSPKVAPKKCTSALELDAIASNILNVLYTDVNCNPGIKAIREEQRDHRHKAGQFTPSQKSNQSIREVYKPPITRQWEEKLAQIIANASSIINGHSNSQNEIMELLLGLDSAYPLSGASLDKSSQPTSLKSSQGSKRREGLDLSINCHPSEENGSSSEDEDEISTVMSQSVFYGEEDCKAVNDAAKVHKDTEKLAKIPESPEEDYFKDCQISNSQMMQLDGNDDSLPPTRRKRRRLGARPESIAVSRDPIPIETRDIGLNLRSRRIPEKVEASKEHEVKSPSRSRPVSPSQVISVGVTSKLSPGVSRKVVGRHGENAPEFDTSQFDDLKKSSPRSSSSRFRQLHIISPTSSKRHVTKRSLSLKSSNESSNAPPHTESFPRKEKHRRRLFGETPTTSKCGGDSSIPSQRFRTTDEETREKVLKVVRSLYESHNFLEAPSEMRVNREEDVISASTSTLSEEEPDVTEHNSELSTQLSEEFRAIEEQQASIKDRVLMWLSESECSQDEAQDFIEPINSNLIKCEDVSREVKPAVSATFDIKAQDVRLDSDTSSNLFTKSSLDSGAKAESGNLSTPSDTSHQRLKSSPNTSLSLFSPVERKPTTCIPNSLDAQSTMTCSPIILSGSESLSIKSTPKFEFDSTLFYSQFNLNTSQQTMLSDRTDAKNFKYGPRPPSVSSARSFIERNLDIIYQDSSSYLMLNGDNTTARQDFCPETQVHIDLVSLAGWLDMCERTPSQVSIVSLRYAKRPPSQSRAVQWGLEKERKRRKKCSSDSYKSVVSNKSGEKKCDAKSAPDFASTPFTETTGFLSVPGNLEALTPIPSKTTVTRFKKKLIFSPKVSNIQTPICPTLFLNSQISHLSNNDSFKFAMTVPMGDSTRSHVIQHLTIMSLECFAGSVAPTKRPDPRYDEVLAVFYCYHTDTLPDLHEGVIAVRPHSKPKVVPGNVTFVATEGDLFLEVFHVVNTVDPDILVGYEIRNNSLGYLIERASTIGLNFQVRISRFPEEEVEEGSVDGAPSNWWVTVTNEVQLTGRIIINLWRLMKTEVNLTDYSFENVSYHVLHERVPLFSNHSLLRQYNSGRDFLHFVEYYVVRTKGNIRLLMDLNIIVRTSEMARLFGIEFFNVLSRGSQYRVESMMTRLAKPLGFVSVSPSPEQRKTMAAPEYIPLVMEPESRMYTDPVVVLDFQSLYPSMIIAYNMCFSTCLGRVNYLGTLSNFPFGCTHLSIPPDLLVKLQGHVFVSPNGVAFVEPSVRQGVLPLMLSEILDTRIQVKEMMKQFKDDKALYRMLDARQLALKLIANVTYGYTSANFSGRMPCIEIGDSIVAKGRETLESTIEIINNTPKWGGRVVYGDTDSVFILFKGCTKDQAFKRGREIAKYITSLHPKPVKLKFEKVYLPCVLQTKKRYVGMKYESENDPGQYEAKGIETVRRDGCPASVKTLKQSLRILFSTYDIMQVKRYVQQQFLKIIRGQVPLQDFIFAKEYRGREGYRPTACVPALEITRKRVRGDPRSEPLVGSRVPYVVCFGTPGLPLIQLIHEPHAVLASPSLILNSTYYITKVIIPALQRVFNLIGVNVLEWYHALPRDLRSYHVARGGPGHVVGEKHTITHYYHTQHCPFCDGVSERLCTCYFNHQKVAIAIHSRTSFLQQQLQSAIAVCRDCTSVFENVDSDDVLDHCITLACPVMYKKIRLKRKIKDAKEIKESTVRILGW